MNRHVAVACLLLVLVAFPAWSAPVITSFSPPYASSNDVNPVVIQGSGFSGGTLTVRFNGRPGIVTGSSSGAIQVKVPADAPLGAGRIEVQVGSSSTESASDFVVIGPGPYLHTFTPAGGNSGTGVTLTGAHFNVGGGSLTVRFNGVPGTVNSSTATSALVFPPAGVTTGRISIHRGVYSYTNDNTMFYVNPVVKGFSPSSGRSGTNVVIRGTNFLGTTGVLFGSIQATFWITNNNVIGAIVPQEAASSKIRIETLAPNPFTTSTNFRVLPTVTGFAPAVGQGGTILTITGANFNEVAANQKPTVAIGSAQATVGTVTFSNLTITVPASASTGPISVTTSNGTHTSSQLFYLPPRIITFNPTNGVPGTIIHIIGTNFTDASAVSFNGTLAESFWVTNNGSIGAQVPEGVVTGPIYVTTPHSTTNSVSRLFYGAPLISGFAPAHGLPGTNVTILGTNFTGASAVSFNGTAAAFSLTNGVLTVIVPTNAQTGPVSITTPAGTTISGTVFTLDYTADLGVSINAPVSALLGTDFTYSITITNRGPYSVPNVTFTNQLPGNVSLKFGSATKPTLITGGIPVRGEFGVLNPGSKVTINLVVTALGIGSAVNTASVSGGFVDPIATNDSVMVSTIIYITPVLGMQRLSETELRLSWSAALVDFILESTGNVTGGGSWTEVLTEAEFIGDQKAVTETIGPESKFYRLRQD
jgi:uncharacterized repeat protein (TIGR01451 family)